MRRGRSSLDTISYSGRSRYNRKLFIEHYREYKELRRKEDRYRKKPRTLQLESQMIVNLASVCRKVIYNLNSRYGPLRYETSEDLYQTAIRLVFRLLRKCAFKVGWSPLRLVEHDLYEKLPRYLYRDLSLSNDYKTDLLPGDYLDSEAGYQEREADEYVTASSYAIQAQITRQTLEKHRNDLERADATSVLIRAVAQSKRRYLSFASTFRYQNTAEKHVLDYIFGCYLVTGGTVILLETLIAAFPKMESDVLEFLMQQFMVRVRMFEIDLIQHDMLTAHDWFTAVHRIGKNGIREEHR
jgi:hypothetical protein